MSSAPTASAALPEKGPGTAEHMYPRQQYHQRRENGVQEAQSLLSAFQQTAIYVLLSIQSNYRYTDQDQGKKQIKHRTS